MGPSGGEIVVLRAVWRVIAALWCVVAPTGKMHAEEGASKMAPKLTLQFGHGGFINGVALTPDGRYAVSRGLSDDLKLWDLESGLLLRNMGRVRDLGRLVLSADGRALTLSEYGRKLELRELSSGRMTDAVMIDYADRKTALAITPDCRWLVFGGGWNEERNVPRSEIWDIHTLQAIATFGMPDPREPGIWLESVTDLAMSGQGRFFAGTNGNGTLALFELPSGRLIRYLRAPPLSRAEELGRQSDKLDALRISADDTLLYEAVHSKARAWINVWDTQSGRLLRKVRNAVAGSKLNDYAFLPDNRRVLSKKMFEGDRIRLWDMTSGKTLNTFEGGDALALSQDGKRLLGNIGLVRESLKLWDLERGTDKVFAARRSNAWRVFPTSRGQAVLFSQLWDVAAGQRIRDLGGADVVALTPDHERAVAMLGNEKSQATEVDVVDIRSGEVVRRIPLTIENQFDDFNVATDGKSVVRVMQDGRVFAWDMNSGKPRPAPRLKGGAISIGEISADLTLLVGDEIERSELVKIWEMKTGRVIASLVDRAATEKTAGKAVPRTHGLVSRVRLNADGTRILTAGSDGVATEQRSTFKIWDSQSGALLETIRSESGALYTSLSFADDRHFLSGSYEGFVELWDRESGVSVARSHPLGAMVHNIAALDEGRYIIAEAGGAYHVLDGHSLGTLATLVSDDRGEWISMTPEGFFDLSSPAAYDLLSVVRGMQSARVDQMYQTLFYPDLVRESLAGDPDGEVAAAGRATNLSKILDSGPAPTVEITAPRPGMTSTIDLMRFEARLTDGGKGVGRIEWRVNGVTAAVTSKVGGAGPEYRVAQELALEPGENTIEVVAYNAASVLASLPAQVTVKFTGSADAVKPTLHVLAIGINAYIDRGWTPPGADGAIKFAPLKLAVNDAKAFAAALRKAGVGQYADVKVTEALDAGASLRALDQAIDRIAAEVRPRDTFVLFAAAHGTSEAGHFYLIPQDYQGGPDALTRGAVGQERLQDWIANRIKAKKALILLDTCESGALVGGFLRSRTDLPASETAVGRLNEATGRPVLTAAAQGEPAFEGYEGHGVFTWALLDALRNGDRNGNGVIELNELAAHVQDQVPKISAKLNGRGRAAVAVRGLSNDRQSARFGSRGEDFAVVRRLQ
jgi:WD40 repeat protein